MKHYDVLVVEDDKVLCEALCDTLEIEGFQVLSAMNGTDALSKLAKNDFKLVISDVQMPVMDGFQLLKNMQIYHRATPVLLMTAYGTVPKAVRAIQDGAVDFLVKPFESSLLIEKVEDHIVRNSTAANDQKDQDASMKKLYQLAGKVAKTDVSVLLQGESGVGKEVFARFIHQHSHYSDGPFIALNCAAIPENMLEAMLFGYEKGAFTGAVQAVPGKFELAQNGTLLLDEIGEMDLTLQAKLLRVLQEKEVERIGSHKKIPLNVRILAATNQKLKKQVAMGNFREDLYYRLSVFPITIPALRDRQDDILPLAVELMQRHLEEGDLLPSFEEKAFAKMKNYHWPGNVRELENVIQRALILKCGNHIKVDDLILENEEVVSSKQQTDLQNSQRSLIEEPIPFNATAGCLGDEIRSAEEKVILQTLKHEKGNRKKVAEKLGISPRTLRYKLARMKHSGIEIPRS